MGSKIKILLFFSIFILALILRLHNYSQYPQRGASSDEYTYSFMGVSLLTKGYPISWSAFKPYKNRQNLTIDNLYFPIVWPYFDHPPFNGLLVGAWAMLNGENDFNKIKLSTIRIMPIVFSLVSLLLIFLISSKLFNFKSALWSGLIYAVSTIVVVQARMVFAENLLAPLFLLSIYLTLLWRKNFTYKKLLLLGIISGISFWTKELGLCVGVATGMLLISEKVDFKKLSFFALTTIAMVSLYFLYGYIYDWGVFWSIFSIQSSREIGPKTLLYLLSSPIIVNKFYYDGWYFLGLIAMFLIWQDYKKYKYIIIPSFTYFFLLVFSLTQEGEMGWYMIPMFPFMAMAISESLLASKKNGIFVLVMLFFVGTYIIRYLWEPFFGLSPFQFRIMMVLLFAPVVASLIFNKSTWLSFLTSAYFYLFIIFTVMLTLGYVHPA